jgi:hypothetical protein
MKIVLNNDQHEFFKSKSAKCAIHFAVCRAKR